MFRFRIGEENDLEAFINSFAYLILIYAGIFIASILFFIFVK